MLRRTNQRKKMREENAKKAEVGQVVSSLSACLPCCLKSVLQRINGVHYAFLVQRR